MNVFKSIFTLISAQKSPWRAVLILSDQLLSFVQLMRTLSRLGKLKAIDIRYYITRPEVDKVKRKVDTSS